MQKPQRNWPLETTAQPDILQGFLHGGKEGGMEGRKVKGGEGGRGNGNEGRKKGEKHWGGKRKEEEGQQF